ncbi:MAG TPA: hypothetical protein VH682_03780 [Gemmataceae bacterium]|jgi:hypothetical protein
MRPHDHADDLTPEQRFQRIAALLAVGLRRLRPRSTPPSDLKNLPELSPNGLELGGEMRLSGHAG